MQPLFAIETPQARWARRLSGVIALWCFGLLACGFYLQHVSGLEPCPMCIVQRYALILTLVFSAFAAYTKGSGARQYLARQMENHFFGDGADAAQGYVPPTQS